MTDLQCNSDTNGDVIRAADAIHQVPSAFLAEISSTDGDIRGAVALAIYSADAGGRT